MRINIHVKYVYFVVAVINHSINVLLQNEHMFAKLYYIVEKNLRIPIIQIKYRN